MTNNCPLCDRELGDINVDGHHLIPKTKGGKVEGNKEPVHKICHRKIHATLTESELAKEWHTWEKLKTHPTLIDFIKWVSKKAPEFYSGSDETNSSKKKRRR